MKIKKEEYFESNQTKLFELYVEYIKGRDIDLILDEFIIKQIINSDNIKFIQENNVKYFIYLYSRLRLKRDVFNDYFADNFDDYDIAIYRIANYLIEIVSINHNINFIIDLLDGTSMYDDSYHFRVLICTIIKTMIHNNNFDINKISIEEISYMIRKSIQNKTYKYIFNGIFIKMNEDIFNKIYDSFIINGDITNLLIFIMNINKEEYFKSNQNKLFELYVNYIKLGEKDIFLETFIIKNISESDNIRFIQKNNVKYFIYVYSRLELDEYTINRFNRYVIEFVSSNYQIEFIIDLLDETSMYVNSSHFEYLIYEIIKYMVHKKNFDINKISIGKISNIIINNSIRDKTYDPVFDIFFINIDEDTVNNIYDTAIKNKEIKYLLIFIKKIKKEYILSNQNKLFELYVDYLNMLMMISPFDEDYEYNIDDTSDDILNKLIIEQITSHDIYHSFINSTNIKYFLLLYILSDTNEFIEYIMHNFNNSQIDDKIIYIKSLFAIEIIKFLSINTNKMKVYLGEISYYIRQIDINTLNMIQLTEIISIFFDNLKLYKKIYKYNSHAFALLESTFMIIFSNISNEKYNEYLNYDKSKYLSEFTLRIKKSDTI